MRNSYSRNLNSMPSLVLIGPGNVGQSVLEQIVLDRLTEHYGRIVVADSTHVVNVGNDRFDLYSVVQAKRNGGRLDALNHGKLVAEPRENLVNYLEPGTIVINAMPTEFLGSSDGLEPKAISADLEAMGNGADLIAGHKSAFRNQSTYKKIMDQAFLKGVLYVPAGAVMGPTRTAEFLRELRNYSGVKIVKVEGVLNGTTNYILSEMFFNGNSFPRALQLAQASKIAEPDPTDDIRGYDALSKIQVPAILFGDLQASDVYGLRDGRSNLPETHHHLVSGLNVLGIEGVTKELLEELKAAGQLVKLVASYNVATGSVEVGPKVLKIDDPLSQLRGTQNMLVLNLDGQLVKVENILKKIYDQTPSVQRDGSIINYKITVKFSYLDTTFTIIPDRFDIAFSYDTESNKLTVIGPGAGNSKTATGLLGAANMIRTTPKWLKSAEARRQIPTSHH